MTQEEKKLLFKDLCARLPYGIKVQTHDKICDLGELDWEEQSCGIKHCDGHYTGEDIEEIKPYLRSMSSVTKKEKEEYNSLFELEEVEYNQGCNFYHQHVLYNYDYVDLGEVTDWLNAHHIDFHDLIHKGLAIEAPEDMYNFE